MEFMQYYQDRLNDCAKSLKDGHAKDRKKTKEEIKRVLLALEKCRVACKEPSDITLSELFALRRFNDCQCQYTPCLIDFVETTAEELYHFSAIQNGYMIFILMPKLRGTPPKFEYLQSLSREQRDEIRQKFKIALE